MFHQLIHNPNIQTFVSLCPNNSSIIYITLMLFPLRPNIKIFFLVSCLAAPMLGFPTEQNVFHLHKLFILVTKHGCSSATSTSPFLARWNHCFRASISPRGGSRVHREGRAAVLIRMRYRLWTLTLRRTFNRPQRRVWTVSSAASNNRAVLLLPVRKLLLSLTGKADVEGSVGFCFFRFQATRKGGDKPQMYTRHNTRWI